MIRPYLTFEMMANDSPKRNAYGDCPHIEIKDMCAIPIVYAALDDRGNQLVKVPFTREMCSRFGIGDVELIQLVQDEVAKKALPVCGLNGFMAGSVDSKQIEELYIATTKDLWYGASVICTYDFFKKAAGKMEGNYYVLPSSVHEVLLVKEDHEVQPKDFRQMVNEVNCMAVEEAERLTNNAYHYDVKRNLLETVDEYQTRLEKENSLSMKNRKKRKNWNDKKNRACPNRTRSLTSKERNHVWRKKQNQHIMLTFVQSKSIAMVIRVTILMLMSWKRNQIQ